MNRAERRAAQRECRRYGHLIKVLDEGRWCVQCEQWIIEPAGETA